MEYIIILIGAVFVNNIVLSQFLGIAGAFVAAMAGVSGLHTEAGAALLQTDGQLRDALDILKGVRVVQSKAD